VNTLATILDKIIGEQAAASKSHPDWVFNIKVFHENDLVGSVSGNDTTINPNVLAQNIDIRYWDWNVNDISQYHSTYTLEITKPSVRRHFDPHVTNITRSMQEFYVNVETNEIDNKPPEDTASEEIDYIYHWIIWSSLKNPIVKHFYRKSIRKEDRPWNH